MDPMENPGERHEDFGEGIPGGAASRGEADERTWEKARESIWSIREQAGRSLQDARERLKDNARQLVIQQKDKSVAGLRRFASAVREAADKLSREGDHALADYTDALGNQIDRAAGYIEHREPGEIMQEVESFVRRQAGLVIGGMFVTGLVVARLLRTSARAGEADATGMPVSGETGYAPPQAGYATSEAPLAQPPAKVESPEPKGTSIPPSASGRFGAGLGPLEP